MIDMAFGCLEQGETITELEIVLSRLVGGILMALSVSSFVLLFSFWSTVRQPLDEYNVLAQACSVDKCRTSLTTQGIIGLSFVMVGLWSDRVKDDDSECGVEQFKVLVGGGAAFLVIACLGLNGIVLASSSP